MSEDGWTSELASNVRDDLDALNSTEQLLRALRTLAVRGSQFVLVGMTRFHFDDSDGYALVRVFCPEIDSASVVGLVGLEVSRIHFRHVLN
ncbi:hypothetical protein C493_21496 [Natronolimnohabitans innermongolicus JCM 12255]|uniref:Uncharacterized protein n=1 Tax=Natronolimnohabitans innermongolicus JCM 12255 TaxID=1227499 RepID=L9WHC1_9EURY|nr:hypothetical protein C493_21496 [Natronolimnohabitans innermongolicus JCM 12255]